MLAVETPALRGPQESFVLIGPDPVLNSPRYISGTQEVYAALANMDSLAKAASVIV